MILVIDKTKTAAANLSDTFYYMGILSHAVTPSEAFSEVSPMYRAIVITSPESVPDVSDYISRLKQYAPEIPIFAVGFLRDVHRSLFVGCFPHGVYAAEIASGIIRACDERGYALPGHYTLAGIDSSVSGAECKYFLDTLPFTKTESMILRTLIRSYPTPISASKILKYAYRTGRAPELPNIRTHIASMNRKFEAVTGRSLIHTMYGKGYEIITPEKYEEMTFAFS